MAAAQNAKIGGDRNSVITVNGHKITVARPGVTTGSFLSTNKDGMYTIANGDGSNLSYVRFGSQTDFNTVSDHYVFALGSLTPTSGSNAVPASGKATYSGLAAFGYDNLTFGTGASEFTVDFGKKTINGSVSSGGGTFTVPLSGTISGNSFSGVKNNVSMKGNFYGPKAAELAGVYKGEATLNNPLTPVMGSFGAKKQ
ncbi:Transferrin binding protein-like solute binding protein [Kingella potus]|uniref:Transferrin binding protein-like solute binding protein n=1 Tax=Kingella potus TaxID=265175 RepID=A0A377R1H4_9NEIS|nr:transferrin-binding protein-like solute binding protein [Kingella potus]UOP00950.1 transferrin-binding protein-like solute binding protein [Kingella potus]STR00608.1 Transferrin binding protein-like solute binding protein [Kingella potus]